MALQDLHFLVVEDHAFQRSLLTQLLTVMGAAAVHGAPDGTVALETLRDQDLAVDVVICDLRMPGMDGMEFIRHLAAEKRPHVSVILLSALDKKLLASVATMAKAYGVRLIGVIEKPLTPAKLRELLDQHDSAFSTLGARVGAPQHEFGQAELLLGLQRGEFEAFVQPKVEVASARVCGSEALARWRHPRHGLVSPAAFVPAMEQGGLIDELTWAMLSQSAEWLARWEGEGLDLSISVNLSLRSLDDTQMADHVADIVLSRCHDPSRMVLEVTESAAATDTARALENLARLRMLGFGLSIDDYGTGYSSMQQLSRIAFTELKIDRAFVAASSSDEVTRVILASSLDMARKLGINAVAEGVESEADWALLKQLGCDMAQGYLIGRPMEAAQFEPWLLEWRHAHPVEARRASH